MILAVGAADIVGGMFHLLSHAFFKSLLFLSAGCVIQASMKNTASLKWATCTA